MALNLTQKQEVVAELSEIAAKAHSLVAAEYAGITVEQMTAMRKKARETGVYLRVVKNTLASRAVAGTEYECVQGMGLGCDFCQLGDDFLLLGQIESHCTPPV